MISRNSSFISAAIFFIIFSFLSNITVSNVQAETLSLGPAWVNGTPEQGQDITLFSSFKAPSNSTTQQYIVDTEVFSVASGAYVTQFFETIQLKSAQSVTRTYAWKTSGLVQGSYIFKQGLFTPDWMFNYSWNNQSGTTTPGGKEATPTPSLKPTSTPTPTVTPEPGNWLTTAALPGNSAQLNTTARLEGIFGVAITGIYILAACRSNRNDYHL